MAEVLRKVTPFEYNYLCDSCNKGMMHTTGEKDDSGLNIHKCMICSSKASFKKVYPHVEFFGKGEEPEEVM